MCGQIRPKRLLAAATIRQPDRRWTSTADASRRPRRILLAHGGSLSQEGKSKGLKTPGRRVRSRSLETPRRVIAYRMRSGAEVPAALDSQSRMRAGSIVSRRARIATIHGPIVVWEKVPGVLTRLTNSLHLLTCLCERRRSGNRASNCEDGRDDEKGLGGHEALLLLDAGHQRRCIESTRRLKTSRCENARLVERGRFQA
jgi:hypothetical protein